MKVMTYGGSANDAADGSLPAELFISHSLKYLLDELHFFSETTAVMISPLVRLQSENILPEWLDILFVERIFQVSGFADWKNIVGNTNIYEKI